jgi:hypothetical protein
MGHLEENLVTNERLTQQVEFLRKICMAELAKDPTSLSADISRSHLMALQHTFTEIYGWRLAGELLAD